MDPSFVALYWNSPLAAREIAGLAVTSAGLYSLSTRKIGAVPVPVPPLDEQREIVRRARDLSDSLDPIDEGLNQAAGRIERSSHALLAKASRGEIATAASVA